MGNNEKETACSLLGFTEERGNFLIDIMEKCFMAGMTKNDSGFISNAVVTIQALEKELDITRIEGLWVAFKLGEACGNKEKGLLLYLRTTIKRLGVK